MRFLFLLLISAICWQSSLFAQHGLHTRFLRQEISSQLFQPANLQFLEYETLALGGQVGVWVNNSSITLDGIFKDGNYITEEAKLQIVDQLGSDNRFQLGLDYTYGMAAIKVGNTRLSLSFRDRTGFHIKFTNPLTAGLIFRGNAPYAGQTISDEEASLRQFRAYEAGIGTSFQKGKLTVGVRAKLFLGRSLNSIDDLRYTFFTEGDGSRIDIQSEYDMYFLLENSGIQGVGAGIDLGAIYEINDKLSLDLAITDLGFISWETRRFNNSVNVSYEGFNLRELIGDGDASADFFVADTFRTLFLPDSSLENYTMGMPATASAGFTYMLNPSARVMGTVLMGLSGQSPSTKLPLVNLAYHRDLLKWLTMGVNAYGGGMDVYGVGIMAQGKFSFKEKYNLRIYGAMDNVLGWAITSAGRGFAGNAGITFGF